MTHRRSPLSSTSRKRKEEFSVIESAAASSPPSSPASSSSSSSSSFSSSIIAAASLNSTAYSSPSPESERSLFLTSRAFRPHSFSSTRRYASSSSSSSSTSRPIISIFLLSIFCFLPPSNGQADVPFYSSSSSSSSPSTSPSTEAATADLMIEIPTTAAPSSDGVDGGGDDGGGDGGDEGGGDEGDHGNQPICTVATTGFPGNKTFPELPKAYSATVNARLNDEVFQFVEEVDSGLDKATRRFPPLSSTPSSSASSRQEIFSFKPTQRQIHIIEGKTCTHLSLSNENLVRDALKVPDLRFLLLTRSIHNFHANSEYFLPPELEMHYEGSQANDNLTLYRWSGCVKYPSNAGVAKRTVFKIDYYFYNSHGRYVPFLVKLKGERKSGPRVHRFDYDIAYSLFQAKESGKDSEIFQVPAGVFCPHPKSGSVGGEYRPKIPKAFGVKFESHLRNRQGMQEITFYEDHYDFDAKLYRRDYPPSPDLKKSFGKHRLTLIQDFGQGVEYYLDERNRNCSGPRKIHSASAAAKKEGGRDYTMNSAAEIFSFGAMNWIYVGKRKTRQLDANVWIDRKEEESKNETTELYMKEEGKDWPDVKASVPLHLYRRYDYLDSRESKEFDVHMFDFRPKKPPYGTFGVAHCYEEKQKMELVFRAQGELRRFVGDHGNRSEEAKRKLTNDLAEWMKIPPPRVTDIHFDDITVEVDKMNRSIVDIWFTLLAAPMIDGHIVQRGLPDLEGAYRNLQRKMKVEHFSFTTIDNTRIYVIDNSLTTGEDVLDPRKVRLTEEMIGYTGGAMIGLGLGMFLIGSLLGVALAYGVWRISRGGSPYSLF